MADFIDQQSTEMTISSKESISNGNCPLKHIQQKLEEDGIYSSYNMEMEENLVLPCIMNVVQTIGQVNNVIVY